MAHDLLLLIRHGIADDDHRLGDRARQLTREGIENFERTANLLAERAVTIRRILSSPYARAVETARILADALGVPHVELRDDLGATSASMAGVIALAQQIRGATAIVGHNPVLTKATAALLRLPTDAVHFLPGTVAALEQEQAAFVLRWVAGPGRRFGPVFQKI